MDAKEVIILGTAHTRNQCPFDCETWGVNGVYGQEQEHLREGKPFRLDKLFITDKLWSSTGTLHFDPKRVNRFAAKYNTDVIALRKLRLGKYEIKSRLYPYQRIVEKFNSAYFTSTICYMLAYALDKGYRKLKLYGVDMLTKAEYQYQKGGVEFWLGYLQGMGGEYYIAPGSAIMVPPTFAPYAQKRKIDLDMVDPYNLLKRNKAKPPQLLQKGIWLRDAGKLKDAQLFVIELGEKHIGFCSYHSTVGSETELGIKIRSDCQNKGYGTEAVKLLIDHILRHTNIRRIYLKTASKQAQSCFQKCGFKSYGQLVKSGTIFTLMEIK